MHYYLKGKPYRVRLRPSVPKDEVFMLGLKRNKTYMGQRVASEDGYEIIVKGLVLPLYYVTRVMSLRNKPLKLESYSRVVGKCPTCRARHRVNMFWNNNRKIWVKGSIETCPCVG